MDSTGHPGRSRKARGRGVLEGAFCVLDVLSRAPDGLGLSELSRECGLPKATTFRLVEQLVEVGAVQRHDRCYFVGKLLVRLGQSWQPHAQLRRSALEPVEMLTRLARSAVVVTVLDGDRVQVVTAARGTVSDLPQVRPGSDLPHRTAAGRVLLANRPDGDPPAGFSASEWRRLRADLRRRGAVAMDHQDVAPGLCCVAAPVCLRDGEVTASISAVVVKRTVPRGLSDLVLRAADKIARNLSVR